jgi:hypothetical protein
LSGDKGGAAEISTAMRVLREIIASDVSLLVRAGSDYVTTELICDTDRLLLTGNYSRHAAVISEVGSEKKARRDQLHSSSATVED